MPGGGTIGEVNRKRTKPEPKANHGSSLDQVRREYIQGIPTPEGRHYPSLSELAKKYGVSLSRLKRVSARERWPEEREKWKARLEEKIQEKKAEVIAAEAVELEREAIEIMKIAFEVAKRKVLQYRERGDVSEYKFARLMEGVRTAYDTARTALGEAPELRVSVEYVAEFEGLNENEAEDEAED